MMVENLPYRLAHKNERAERPKEDRDKLLEEGNAGKLYAVSKNRERKRKAHSNATL
jgi:hypothetical protein